MRFPTIPDLVLLLQEAPAAAPGTDLPTGETAPKSNPLMSMVPFLAIIALFYFLMILPERKKQKKRNQLLASMKKGDRVMTSGGMYGTIAQVQDDAVVLQVADGVRLRFNRAAIQTIESDEASAKQEPQKA